MKSITAVIPLRAGSQRVQNKGLRPFANTTLLKLKIDELKRSDIFDNIVVNTDSEEAIAIAKECGVSYHRREAYYASSECSGSDFFEYLGRTTNSDIFAYSPPTSPLVNSKTFQKCVQTFLDNMEIFDCLSTVSSVKEFLWLDGKPINYDVYNAPNSQDLPNIVALNFACTLIETHNLIKNRNIIGEKPTFVEIGEIESVDIDTEFDFYLAEQIYIKTVLEKKSLLE